MAIQAGSKAQASAPAVAWAPEASADVLALFAAPLPLAATTSGGSSGSSARRAAAAAALPLPPLPLPPLPFALPLPPLPDAAGAALGGLQQPAAALPAFDPVAAAAYLLNPSAANLAAATAAPAEQPAGGEDSLADAASCPALPAAPAPSLPAAGLPAVGQPFRMASALTSHLSDVAGPGDAEMHGERRLGLQGWPGLGWKGTPLEGHAWLPGERACKDLPAHSR